MEKHVDSRNTKVIAIKSAQSVDSTERVKIDQNPPTYLSDPEAVDRPGFDLGGSTGETTAGSGVGLGTDARESRADESLPGRPAGATLTIPRWSGPTPIEPSPSHQIKTPDPIKR